MNFETQRIGPPVEWMGLKPDAAGLRVAFEGNELEAGRPGADDAHATIPGTQDFDTKLVAHAQGRVLGPSLLIKIGQQTGRKTRQIGLHLRHQLRRREAGAHHVDVVAAFEPRARAGSSGLFSVGVVRHGARWLGANCA